MIGQHDKERPASASDGRSDHQNEDVSGKDPDVYDPMGMAGQKAGIVEEIEQELHKDGQAQPPRDNAPGAGKDRAAEGKEQRT